MGLASARVFPFSEGGSAAGAPWPVGAVTLTDLTARSRFGIKGPGSSAWLVARGLTLPAVNRIGEYEGDRLLRLGSEDFLILSGASEEATNRLISAWASAAGPRGYSSWREEGWAWLRLGGAAAAPAMARLCAIDLRAKRFGRDDIAHTRVAGLEAVLFRHGEGYDVLFDVTASAFFARTISKVAQHLPRDVDQNEDRS